MNLLSQGGGTVRVSMNFVLRKKDDGGFFSFLNQNQENFSDEEDEKPLRVSPSKVKQSKNKSTKTTKSSETRYKDDGLNEKLFGELKNHVAETCGAAFGNISKQMSPLEITLQELKDQNSKLQQELDNLVKLVTPPAPEESKTIPSGLNGHWITYQGQVSTDNDIMSR